MKRTVFFIALIFFSFLLFAETEPLHFNPWELIIYRPENSGRMNEIRCWLKAEDAETGEDVTYTRLTATYEWVDDTIIVHKNPLDFRSLFIPSRKHVLYPYQRTYYLSGGMAMHLNLAKGKYKFSVYTPKDKTNLYETENKDQWESNVFYYDTENPAKVIFVFPTANQNGFYNGGWVIDAKAPEYFEFTKPKM